MRAKPHVVPWLMLSPALVMLSVFLIYPMVNAIALSFTSWDGISDPAPVGLRNFGRLVADPHVTTALLNHLKMALVLPLWVLIPYAVAMALNTKPPGWKFFRLALFLPAVTAPLILGIYYGLLLAPEGPLNHALGMLGLPDRIEWLNSPSLTVWVVIAILIWSTIGIGSLIFLAAFEAIDLQQVEAAKLDGANWWQIQRHVVIWQMIHAIRFWAILVVILSFTGVFPLVYALTQGGPGYSSYFMDFAIYQEAFQNSRLGYASALAVALVLLLAIVAMVQFRAGRRRNA